MCLRDIQTLSRDINIITLIISKKIISNDVTFDENNFRYQNVEIRNVPKAMDEENRSNWK